MFLCITCYAQVPDNAAKYYSQSLQLKTKKQHAKAAAAMEEAIKASPGYSEAYSVLGEWYFQAQQYDKAVDVFQRASAACKNGQSAFAKPLAKSLLGTYRPAEAQALLNSYMPAKNNADWIALKADAQFMQQALRNAWKDTVVNLTVRVNTPDPEMYPSITSDTQNIYFTRRVNNANQDFFFTTIDTCGGWLTARSIGSPPNSPDQEYAQMISADKHYLFFTRCDNRSENGWEQGGCDLYMAYRADSVWSIPQSFGATINTPAYEAMPYLSADNRELFFVSDRPGGYGGLDIWVSRFETGLWQLPRNLGPEVNTAKDETAPFLHIDNNTLCFASNGHPGMGGSDLYMCRRVNDSSWTGVHNMGYPINTAGNENSLCITADGNRLYFASDRDSMLGNYDIYEMPLPEQLKPRPVVFVKGFSYDSLSKEQLNYASIYINDAATGQQIYHFQSNRGDGSYTITLPKDRRYIYNADRIGYLAATDTLDFRDASAAQQIEYNIALLPHDYVQPVYDSTVLTVYFPINSKTLSDTAKATIQGIMANWLQPGVTIFINGYTDNTGTPMLNEELSYMRAGLVANEVTAMGIDPMNIQSQGWGEANPLDTNDTEEGRNKNRRVEIIVRR